MKTEEKNKSAVESYADSAHSALASESAQKTDSILKDVITSEIGDGWTMADIEGRLVSVRVQGDPQEMIMLDGKPILELWPTEIKTEQRGNATVLVSSRSYRAFNRSDKDC